VGIAVITNDNGITLFPFERESILVLKVNPLSPFGVGEFRKISEGQLDWSILSLELLDTGPRVEPHVMVCNRGIDNVTIKTGSELKGRHVELGLHVKLFTQVVTSPGNLKATLFCSCLSLFWAIGHK
jgi:hypothetical protein